MTTEKQVMDRITADLAWWDEVFSPLGMPIASGASWLEDSPRLLALKYGERAPYIRQIALLACDLAMALARVLRERSKISFFELGHADARISQDHRALALGRSSMAGTEKALRARPERRLDPKQISHRFLQLRDSGMSITDARKQVGAEFGRTPRTILKYTKTGRARGRVAKGQATPRK